VRVFIKREDLNHAFISGNKWWKLKYNLEEATKSGLTRILTFGGAYSNHIYATAAAARECGFDSIGIIRGEKITPLNATLKFAEQQGMHLHFISREAYKRKTESIFIEELKDLFGDFYLIPEGGTNDLAVKGCAEFASKELSDLEFDHFFLPVGTGGTIAGIISSFEGKKNVIGIPVLKNAEFLQGEIQSLLKNFLGSSYGNWQLLTSYHHGGYAKVSEALKRFIVTMKAKHDLPLDPVYTAKMLWAVINEAELGHFKQGSTILTLHTGGLQGSADIMK
jgi:1-aminocyclopropane-1-carboxylate deaminase/D-cysteine desulfhydrase-like pyridoxal-dependent ACC family enzyme